MYLTVCSKKIIKRLLRILKPEMSLVLLISSYLLPPLKHMQEENKSKSKSGKETTKSNRSPPHLSPSAKSYGILLILRFDILSGQAEFSSIYWKYLKVNLNYLQNVVILFFFFFFFFFLSIRVNKQPRLKSLKH